MMLEVGAVGARVCSVSAVAVLTVAAAVLVVWRRRERRLRREVVSERLMAGCSSRDSAALRDQLEGFRRRLDEELGSVDAVPAPRGPMPAPAPSVPAPARVPSVPSWGAPPPVVAPSFSSPVASTSEGGQ